MPDKRTTLTDQDVEMLTCAMQHALEYLETLDTAPVKAPASLEDLRRQLGGNLPEQETDPKQVIDELVRDTANGLQASSSGRFFAWVLGGNLPVALAADWLTSTWDQNVVLHACSPAGSVIEEVCGAWLKQIFGLPASAGFGFTTGTQMAHVIGLAAARHRLLQRRGWNVELQGLHGAPRLRVLTSQEFHGSITRAVRMLGLGANSIVPLATNAYNQLDPDALECALKSDPDAATIVVLLAGDLNTGSFDDFTRLIALSHHHKAWVHVDGAFGLWAAASEKYRHLLTNVAAADSWVVDGHKWLNVPYDSGYVFVADPVAQFESASHRESYLMHVDGARDPMDWNPEWSRRGRAITTYAVLRHLGTRGLASMIERSCELAKLLVDEIGRLPNTEIIHRPIINQGLVRFIASDEESSAALTDAVIDTVNASGEAFFGGTNWGDMRCMRVSVCNWRTTEQDIERAVSAISDALNSLA